MSRKIAEWSTRLRTLADLFGPRGPVVDGAHGKERDEGDSVDDRSEARARPRGIEDEDPPGDRRDERGDLVEYAPQKGLGGSRNLGAYDPSRPRSYAVVFWKRETARPMMTSV